MIEQASPIPADALADDALVTQRQLQKLAGNVSGMTIWRWRRAGLLPDPACVRGRNYWRLRDVREALERIASAAPAEAHAHLHPHYERKRA